MSAVSIIIPTHNRPKLLPRAVASARAAGTEVEIIVVDDASQDETAAVCRALPGIKYIRLKRNQGVAAARNVGILASSAEFVAFLDDDDLRLPDSLDLQTAMLAAEPQAGFVCGAMLIADQDYRLTGEVSAPPPASEAAFWQLLELDFPVMPLSTVIRKECFLRVGLLNQHLRGIDDWEILVRIAELFPVLTTSEPVGIYRQPAPTSLQGSSVQSAQLRRAADQQTQLFKLPRVKAAPKSQRKAIRQRTVNRVVDTLLWNAWLRLPDREFRFAAANILTAIRLGPFRVLRPGIFRRMVATLGAQFSTSAATTANVSSVLTSFQTASPSPAPANASGGNSSRPTATSLASIIITTHNRPHLLRRAITSALHAGMNAEVIVVDDASTDDTANACANLPGIKYVRVDRNQGVAGARNLGLLASRGEYVTFLDDDDLRLPGSLDKQVNLLEANHEAGVVYGQAVITDQSGRPTEQSYPQGCPQGDLFWELLGRNFIPCGSAVFRRSCLEHVGLLDQSVAGLDDWDLWIRIADLYPIIALAEPVMHWRRSTPSSSQGTSQAAAIVSRSVRQFRERWQKLPRVTKASPETQRGAWRQFSANMAGHLLCEVLRALRHRQIVQASRNLFALLRLGPFVLLRLLRAQVAGDNSLRLDAQVSSPIDWERAKVGQR